MSEEEKVQGEDRKRELEAELERHKERFLAASRRGIDALKGDLSAANWIRDYPIETAVVAFLGGLFLGLAKPLDRSRHSFLR